MRILVLLLISTLAFSQSQRKIERKERVNDMGYLTEHRLTCPKCKAGLEYDEDGLAFCYNGCIDQGILKNNYEEGVA